ncbi:MAG: DEAD/DEAH box helicase [Bauldia sp.]|nr:DEAD/DEAH box helicase [Bauldia sp.]
MNSFSELGLAAPIASALVEEGHSVPTPIQAQAIPFVTAGRDIVAIAQTGTGKTAAFALPILHRLANDRKTPAPRTARVLVLSPTRELSNQIEERFNAYGRHLRLRTAIAIGGVPIGKQIRALAQGVDILVATPGRLVDLMQERAVTLDKVEVFVLDEADRMLDMGFIHTIRSIAARVPKTRQTLLFSATMPKEIAALADAFLSNPARVAVTPVATTAERIEQHVVHVESGAKTAVLAKLLAGPEVGRALVFARTKRGADRVVKGLAAGGFEALAIHGNKSQPQRERALDAFRRGEPNILVATDIAARGIDVDGITHVFNFDLPDVAESYVHRIGRTARAGATGIAIALVAGDERGNLRAIERLTRQAIPVMTVTDVDLAATRVAREPERDGGPRRRGGWTPHDHRSHAATPPAKRGQPRHKARPAGNDRGEPAAIAGVAFMQNGTGRPRHAEDGNRAGAAPKPAGKPNGSRNRRRQRPAGRRNEARVSA